MASTYLISSIIVTLAFLGGFALSDLDLWLTWFTDKAWPKIMAGGMVIAGVWRWWHVTRKKERADGVLSEFEIVKARDEALETVTRRVDLMAKQIDNLRAEQDHYQEKLSRYMRYERRIKLECIECHELAAPILISK